MTAGKNECEAHILFELLGRFCNMHSVLLDLSVCFHQPTNMYVHKDAFISG